MPINRMKDLALVVYFENLTDTLPLFRYIILSHYILLCMFYTTASQKEKWKEREEGEKVRKG